MRNLDSDRAEWEWARANRQTALSFIEWLGMVS